MRSQSVSPSGSTHADPVRALLQRHSTLCRNAVDPLEIVAGLEAGGVTDRTAASCRHRDVFSLAEELYARAPRPYEDALRDSAAADGHPDGSSPDEGHQDGSGADSSPDEGHPDGEGRVRRHRAGADPTGAPTAGRSPAARWGAVLALPLLPGLLCAGTLAWLVLLDGAPSPVRTAVCGMGTVAVLVSAVAALRTVFLDRRTAGHRVRRVPVLATLYVCWLTGYALYGDRLSEQLLTGGPDLPAGVPAPPAPVVVLSLTAALAPAVWCARAFERGARRRLADTRGLERYSARVRPLLVLSVLAFVLSLPVLQWAAHRADRGPLAAVGPAHGPGGLALAATAALALLLFAALLLAAHGFRGAARAGLATACALEAAVMLSVPAARLPHLAPLGRPAELLAAHQAVAAVPLAACGCAALAALAYAAVTLTRAAAHHREAGTA